MDIHEGKECVCSYNNNLLVLDVMFMSELLFCCTIYMQEQ